MEHYYQGQYTSLPACYLSSWKELESELIFSNSFIEVFNDKVLSPSSEKCDYSRVHFKRTGVGILVCYESWILLVGQRRYPLGKFSWEIPEGGTDSICKNPKEAAVREVMEETGISITTTDLQELLQLHTSNCVTDELCIVYRMKLEEKVKTRGSSIFKDEVILSKWFRLEECTHFIEEGIITDAISVAAILKETKQQFSTQT